MVAYYSVDDREKKKLAPLVNLTQDGVLRKGKLLSLIHFCFTRF